MPFKYEILHFNQVELHLIAFESFNPSDYFNHLTSLELERFYSIHSKLKQQQFIATRYLRHQLFGHEHIHYTEIGAPFIQQEGYISISHSKNLVGIAFCKEFQVGLDLEYISGKAKKVHLKFLNTLEKDSFDCSSDEEMTKLWSAKETLYKLANRKGIDFKTELILAADKENCLSGKIIQQERHDLVEIYTFVHQNYVITLNHSKIVHVNNLIPN